MENNKKLGENKDWLIKSIKTCENGEELVGYLVLAIEDIKSYYKSMGK